MEKKLIVKKEKKKNWNKKALEDSVFTWVIAFSVIVFIMFLYGVFVFIIFGGEKITGKEKVVFEGSSLDLDLNLKFLNFLNSKILVDSKEEKVIDVIRSSLDPYFEIENDGGENLIGKFGLKAITSEDTSLNSKMLAFGFGNEGWDKFLKANFEFENGDSIKKISELIDEFCEFSGEYFLKIPQGIIIKEGLKNPDETIKNLAFVKQVSHQTNYRGENFEIILECRG